MQSVLVLVIYIALFLSVILAVQAGSQIIFASGDQKQRTNRRLAMLDSGMDPREVYSALLRRSARHDGTGLMHYYDLLCVQCRQAGIDASPPTIVFWVAVASVSLWCVSIFFSGFSSLQGLIVNGTLTLVASILICGLSAWLWIRRRKSKRLQKLEEQMPLALDVITRAIRAGHPVVSAVQLAGNEMGDPIGSEFGLIVDETTYGSEFKEALANFARRTGSQDAHFFAVSVGVQAETGGNLAEILDGLASVIRSRATLAKRVKALSSEGRASALLLSVLPIFLVSFLGLSHPEFYTSKFSDPIFWPVNGIIGVLYLVGLLMIHRIINFKY
jgi:tight adherence protein B